MVFVNGSGPIPSVDFAFPDVCINPLPPPPKPLPFPNLALGPTAIPSQLVVFTMMMPSHNLLTVKPISEGDQAGILGGVISHNDMGPVRNVFGSVNLFIGGPPATKMTSPTGQNGLAPNTAGATISPAQIVFLSLS
jgi:hypothetical protein